MEGTGPCMPTAPELGEGTLSSASPWLLACSHEDWLTESQSSMARPMTVTYAELAGISWASGRSAEPQQLPIMQHKIKHLPSKVSLLGLLCFPVITWGGGLLSSASWFAYSFCGDEPGWFSWRCVQATIGLCDRKSPSSGPLSQCS